MQTRWSWTNSTAGRVGGHICSLKNSRSGVYAPSRGPGQPHSQTVRQHLRQAVGTERSSLRATGKKDSYSGDSGSIRVVSLKAQRVGLKGKVLLFLELGNINHIYRYCAIKIHQ